ncbi:hypothetical protein MASR1M74_12610 [Lentimicrobium sp.]
MSKELIGKSQHIIPFSTIAESKPGCITRFQPIGKHNPFADVSLIEKILTANSGNEALFIQIFNTLIQKIEYFLIEVFLFVEFGLIDYTRQLYCSASE